MLKAILAVLLLTASPDVELKRPIEWNLTVKITNELTIRSYYVNHDREDIDRVIFFYAKSLDKFPEFRNLTCEIKPLEIRIITEQQMNSPEFFTYTVDDSSIYGRYFKEDQHMYLTTEATHNKRYFAHEMAHYLFDICGVKFNSLKEEHMAVRKFVKYLEKK